MPRSIWKGSITFGLVTVPVSLIPAESRPDIQLHMVDSKNHSRIRYDRVHVETGEDFPWGRPVKGYEHEEGQFVLLSEDDMETVHPKLTKTIEITEFVKLEEIDPILFEKPYYLAPERRGFKAYSLLREALRGTGMAGISRIVIRTREYLSAMFVRDDVLMVMLLRFPQGIRATSALDLPASDDEQWRPVEKELDLAIRLINELSTTWKPDNFQDDYRKALKAFIERKIESGDSDRDDDPPHQGDEEEVPNGKVLDLASYLERPLKESRTTKAKAPAISAPAKRHAAKKAPGRTARHSA